MTALECVLFSGGAVCVVRFIVGTAAPRLRRRFVKTADRASRDFRGEFLALSPGQAMAFFLVAGVVLAAATLLATGDPAWAVVVGSAPTLLSGLAVRHFRATRRKRVVAQLPVFLDVLAGHARAGHSLQEALLESVPLLPAGIREEVSWMSQLIRLGTPLADALHHWERRMPCDELFLAVRPLRLAIPAGGNVVALLERTRDALRANIRMAERMRSMTAQARLQACVLTLLPPAFIAALSRIDPGFLPRCLGSTQGKLILAAAAILQILGWVTIRKILAVKP